MAEAGRAQSPNEQLADAIAEALGQEGLVPRARVNELRRQLASGSVREADWRVLIETALPGTEQGGGHG